MQRTFIDNSESPTPLFNTIVSLLNLHAAATKAFKGKRSRPRYADYIRSMPFNLMALNKELKSGTYVQRKTKEFDLWCISGQKMRHISVPHLDDCVIQHAIYRVVFPLIDPKLIYDNYGCRLGKGTHKASNRCQYFIRQSPADSWYLQLDFRKYYYNLDHSKLRDILLHLIHEERTVDLILTQFPQDTDVGMNVGAMISQLMGMIYLDEFDHYIKRVLKIKHYIRYVDDVVIIGLTKEDCQSLAAHLTEYARRKFKLEFSKIKIAPLSRGINFVGYRTWSSKRIIRKRSMKTFKRNVRKHRLLSVRASLGHAKHTSSHTGMIDYMRNW